MHSKFFCEKYLMSSALFFLYFVIQNFHQSFGKNILLIVLDDLRPALSSYANQNAFTPNIDDLSQESLIFQRAYCQQALCAPSRNSFLTSRRPDSLHLYDFYSYWRHSAGNFTTLPQYFKENNYRTASFGKVFHPGISSNYSDDQPYSWTENPYHPPSERFQNAKVCRSALNEEFAQNLICPVVVSEQPGKTLPDLETLSQVKVFLEKQNKSEKFFLGVGFHKPHIPLKFPEEYLKFHPLINVTLPAIRQKPIDLPSVAWNPWTDLRERDDIKALRLTFPYGMMNDHWIKLIRLSYFAAVSYVDDLIGQLLRTLAHVGFKENTIILLTSDHGWSLGEHGEWSKYSNFESAVNVPLILRVPGTTEQFKGHFSKKSGTPYTYANELVELVDVFPTLVELAGLKPIPLCPLDSSSIELCSEGISLVPLINHYALNLKFNKTKSLSWKKGVFSQYPRPGLFPTENPNSDKPKRKDIKIMGYSLRTDVFRYTEWVQFNPISLKANWSAVKATELYHHGIDPEENINLAKRPGFAEVCTALSKQLRSGWKHNLPPLKHS